MSASEDAKRLRTWLTEASGRGVIIGNAGGCEKMLINVLDRLDELEWIVKTMRERGADHD